MGISRNELVALIKVSKSLLKIGLISTLKASHVMHAGIVNVANLWLHHQFWLSSAAYGKNESLFYLYVKNVRKTCVWIIVCLLSLHSSKLHIEVFFFWKKATKEKIIKFLFLWFYFIMSPTEVGGVQVIAQFKQIVQMRIFSFALS